MYKTIVLVCYVKLNFTHLLVHCPLGRWQTLKKFITSLTFRPLTKMELGGGDIKVGGNISGSESIMSCLVAVGRDQPTIASAIDDALHRGKEVVDGVEFVAR